MPDLGGCSTPTTTSGAASPPPPPPSPGRGGIRSASSARPPSRLASPPLPSEPARPPARHLFDEMQDLGGCSTPTTTIGVASPPPPRPSPGCGGSPSTPSNCPSGSISRPTSSPLSSEQRLRRRDGEIQRREQDVRQREVEVKQWEEAVMRREEGQDMRMRGREADEVRWKELRQKINEDEEDDASSVPSCFGAAFLRWNDRRRTAASDEARASLKEQLLTPQQPKPMPTPLDTPTATVADTTTTTMGTLMATPKPKVYPEGIPPRFERPTIYDVLARPDLVESTSQSKDLQMVKIGLRVLTRQGENFNERVLPSIIHETLKALVAEYNASQLITQRETLSRVIKKALTDRARSFKIALDDVSITSLSLLTASEEERAKFIDAKADDNRSAIIRAQVYPEGTHFMDPWAERPTICDVHARPNLVESTSESKDLQKEDDQTWNKSQIGYIFDLGTALFLIFLIRPMLPTGYDRWLLVAFAAVWGLGSVGLPIGLFGTSRFEKNWSRHVGRFISLCLSLLVIYAIYILTLCVAGTPAPTPSSSLGSNDDADADVWMMFCFGVIAAFVFCGHLYSWIRGCCTGGDRDREPLDG